MGDVSIFEIDRGFSLWAWLCHKHLMERKKAGWSVKTRKPAPHPLTCDDCKRSDHEHQEG